MKKIFYVVYKIVNWLILIITPITKNVSRDQHHNLDFYFDFSHHTMHLGDRLFYIDAFKAISNLGKNVYISPQDNLTSSIINEIDPTINIIKCTFSPKLHTLVIPAQTFLSSFKRHPISCQYIVIKYNQRARENISEQLCKILELPYSPISSGIKDDNKANSKKYAILSNYIDSGFFRKRFSNENSLYEKARKLKKSNYYIIHVGTRNDRINDGNNYDFIDCDARGKLTIPELIFLIRDFRPTIISYDNFLMHLGIIYSCKVYVLFRGRFTKKAKNFHYQCVNECLRKKNGHVRYL